MSQLSIKPIPECHLDQIHDLLISDENCMFLLQILGFIPGRNDICRHTIKDSDFEPKLFLGAYIGEQLVGNILGIHRPWKKGRRHIGYLKWIFVKREYRRRGIGGLLLETCEQRFQMLGCVQLLYGSCSPAYLFPGIPKEDHVMQYFFRAFGWMGISERVSLHVNLSSLSIHPYEINTFLSLHQSISIGAADPIEKKSLINFIEREFSHSWALESLPAFDKNLQSFCSYVVDKKTGDFLGFLAVGAGNPNWLGPMGVKAEKRGQGLGETLLRYSLLLARERGIKRLIFSWVNESEGFYRKALGPVDRLVFQKYQKIIQ